MSGSIANITWDPAEDMYERDFCRVEVSTFDTRGTSMCHLREMRMNMQTVLSPTELMLVANVTTSNRCGQLSETAALKNFHWKVNLFGGVYFRSSYNIIYVHKFGLILQ